MAEERTRLATSRRLSQEGNGNTGVMLANGAGEVQRNIAAAKEMLVETAETETVRQIEGDGRIVFGAQGDHDPPQMALASPFQRPLEQGRSYLLAP